MDDYTPSELVDMLIILGESRRNYRQAAFLYHDRYPARRTIFTTIRKIQLRALV